MGNPMAAVSKLLILIVSLIIVTPVFSGNDTHNIDEALSLLKNAPRVESRRISEGAEVSRLFHAYSILKGANDPAALFAKLNKESLTNAGKVYAAIWFHSYDPPSYSKAKASITDDEVVEVLIGCIVSRYPMKEILDKIEKEDFAASLEMTGPGF